jgi:outer membrane protein TolC
MGQLNRATRNNGFGMVLPNGVCADFGPLLAVNAGTNADRWLGLISWSRRLGQRLVKTAESEATAAVRAEEERLFSARASAADAYLCVLAADATKRSAEASLDRAKKVEELTGALAKAGLKPEADWMRARAELAAAEAVGRRARRRVWRGLR